MNAESAAQFLPLIMIVLMMAAMYFLVFWPQRKREKKTKAMLAAIKVGDKVMTIGGVIGKVSAIKDDIITIDCGPEHSKIPFTRSAIRSVIGADGETGEL